MNCVVADDVIYQWTDTWGQKQYSLEPVPGSTVSDLKELPKSQPLNEQEKQQYRNSKFEQVKQQAKDLSGNTESNNQLRQLAIIKERDCRKLRSLLSYQQSQRYSQYNRRPGAGALQYEMELRREIRERCR